MLLPARALGCRLLAAALFFHRRFFRRWLLREHRLCGRLYGVGCRNPVPRRSAGFAGGSSLRTLRLLTTGRDERRGRDQRPRSRRSPGLSPRRGTRTASIASLGRIALVMVERYANRFDAVSLTFVEVAAGCLVFLVIAVAGLPCSPATGWVPLARRLRRDLRRNPDRGAAGRGNAEARRHGQHTIGVVRVGR